MPYNDAEDKALRVRSSEGKDKHEPYSSGSTGAGLVRSQNEYQQVRASGSNREGTDNTGDVRVGGIAKQLLVEARKQLRDAEESVEQLRQHVAQLESLTAGINPNLELTAVTEEVNKNQ